MSRIVTAAGCLALLISGPAGLEAASEVKTLEIGAAAADFELPGVDGKTYKLADFADAKVLVVVFTCNHCPTAQAYEERLEKLDADYKDRGVALVAISPNDPLALRLDELGYTDVGDSFEDMKIRAKDRDFKFPYLYDGQTQKVSRAYGVLATPHVFIFDAARRLRYVGRVDDSDVREVASHDARNAIDALLAGKPVPVEKTRVFGCSTKWSDKRTSVKESLAKWDAEPVGLESISEEGMKSLVRNESKNLRLINVWATWCGPCISEMPKLVEMNRMYRKRRFEMFTISIDEPGEKDQLLKILKENHVSSTNYHFAGGSRDKLAEALDAEWPGPVPYTILVAPGGKIIYRGLNEVKEFELRRAIVDYLGRTYASR